MSMPDDAPETRDFRLSNVNVRSEPASRPKFLLGLSARLLMLTIAFVLLAEVLIFVPSVANFRNVWLEMHLRIAEAASIVYLDTTDPMLSEKAQTELLKATGAVSVVIREGSMRRLMAASSDMPEVTEHIDLTSIRPVQSITSAMGMLFSTTPSAYRVFSTMTSRDSVIELVQYDDRLKGALRIYARNVALLSLAISLITATLVYLALYGLIVRPMVRLSANMEAFGREPDNASLILNPSQRNDEIGIAERRLSLFQTELHRTLRQRQHLADLGLAVSKINHDLRNILASAQVFSDRLSDLPDPTVQRLAPKLLRAINRAADYTRAVLAYGKADEDQPRLRRLRLKQLVEEVGELLGLAADSGFGKEAGIEWRNDVDPAIEILADPEQMLRVLLNIGRNAVQAMNRDGDETGRAEILRLSITAEKNGGRTLIRVSDTGPGIPDIIRDGLFRPFAASSRAGGTGLGLVIAAELARAQGGAIQLASSTSAGTVFLITMPSA